jgi:hypothetical protein
MSQSSAKSPTPSNPPDGGSTIEQMVEFAAERWRVAGGKPDSDLLRLAVTRDLMHSLHAEKSRFLSKGQRDEASKMKAYEKKIDEIRSSAPLSAELRDILSGSAPLKKRTRLLPEALFGVLSREKFERYDRQWEAALASEANQIGWDFYGLDAKLEIQKIDEWNNRLKEHIWPNGIVLFVESVSLESEKGTQPATWQGRWIIVIKSQLNSNLLSTDLSNWPGTQGPVTWKLLFSSKNR